MLPKSATKALPKKLLSPMKLTIVTPKSAGLALAVVILSVSAVQAVPTTYSYTGNPFTSATTPYTTSMFVTAMVTLAGPLGPNMPLTHVDPTAFTFFDGVQTLNSTNSHPNPIAFSFATNANGEIISWRVEVDGGGSSIFTINDVLGAGDGGHTSEAIGSNRDSPGVWSQGIATPDTGSTLSLTTLTLMAFGLVRRKLSC
jgi:hypothetical protein